MELVIRRSNDNDWGFVESFNHYRYGSTGTITVTVGINGKGKIKEPYVLRNGEFIPLKQIDEEMGIVKYIKAKKPFYCLLKDGFIVTMKVGIDFNTGEFIESTSDYVVYMADSSKAVNDREGKLHLTRILEVPSAVEEIVKSLMIEIAAQKGSREDFLRSRF